MLNRGKNRFTGAKGYLQYLIKKDKDDRAQYFFSEIFRTLRVTPLSDI